MTDEKKVSHKWFDCLFGHVTGSVSEPKKNSCEIFSLTLTRQEIIVLGRGLSRVNGDGDFAPEDVNVVIEVCKKIRSLLCNFGIYPEGDFPKPQTPHNPPPADLE